MAQTGVMKVRLADGSWKHVGFPNPGDGVFKVRDRTMFHYADNAAIVRTGRLKVNIGGGEWQHVSWMRGPYIPIPSWTLRGHSEWDVFGFDGPGDKPLPLPPATELGDLMVLSLSPHSWEMNDPRFTDYGHGAYVGYATHLGPVTLYRTAPGGTQRWAQAVLLTFAEGYAVVAETQYAASNDTPFDIPVIGGSKAAMACIQGTTSTVHGYTTLPVPPWLGGNYASTSAGYAGVYYWSDLEASSSPDTQATILGSGENAGITVLSFVGVFRGA